MNEMKAQKSITKNLIGKTREVFVVKCRKGFTIGQGDSETAARQEAAAVLQTFRHNAQYARRKARLTAAEANQSEPEGFCA